MTWGEYAIETVSYEDNKVMFRHYWNEEANGFLGEFRNEYEIKVASTTEGYGEWSQALMLEAIKVLSQAEAYRNSK